MTYVVCNICVMIFTCIVNLGVTVVLFYKYEENGVKKSLIQLNKIYVRAQIKILTAYSIDS